MSHLSSAQRLFKSLGEDTDWLIITNHLAGVMIEGGLHFRDIDPDGDGGRASFLAQDTHCMFGAEYIRTFVELDYRSYRTRALFEPPT